jgi:hypothetical protein
MKTIKNIKTGEIKRVTDKEADDKVKYGWEYTPKSEWKSLRPKIVKTEKKELKRKKNGNNFN